MVDEQCILKNDYMEIWHSKSDEGPGIDFHAHTHAEYEILYVLSGDVEFYVEGYKYPFQPESLLLTPPNNFHGWKLRSHHLYHRVAVLFMMPEFLPRAEQSFFMELFNKGPRFFTDISSRNIGFFIDALLKCVDMEAPLQEISLKSRLVSLLSEIAFLQSSHAREPASRDKRIQQVLMYLGEHLAERPAGRPAEEFSLDSLSQRFSISKNYLNILFREATGTTVNQYIRLKRLVLARQELLNGSGAEEAAYKAGFNDYSNFFRAYKAFFGAMPTAKTSKPDA
jgi:AraC-like DNA-binding protein